MLSGRTENNRVVNFKGDSGYIGRFVDLKVSQALPNSLRGEVLGVEEAPQRSSGAVIPGLNSRQVEMQVPGRDSTSAV
jgi:hypothetical protein